MLGRALEISGIADSTLNSPRRSSMDPRWSGQILAATTGSAESSPWAGFRGSRWPWSTPIGPSPTARSIDESFRPGRAIAVNAKRTRKRPTRNSEAVRGRADLARLRRVSEREIRATSPPELADLPDDFWDDATVVEPSAKQPISLRVDTDVLRWFKAQGPRYQSRINAVLRSYMTQRRQSSRRKAG